jgi:hypothetical protein
MKVPIYSDAITSIPESPGHYSPQTPPGRGCAHRLLPSRRLWRFPELQLPNPLLRLQSPTHTPGALLDAYQTVTATAAASIGPAFAGLSYEKSQIHQPIFTTSNSNLIGLLKSIGPSVLRIDRNTVDQTVWNPSGAGRAAGQVALIDIDPLAAFVKAIG